MSQGAASFTIQLNSATAEKRTGEHYVRQLDPPITIPYLAKPRAMLEGLSFSNSFSNVDSNFENNKDENRVLCIGLVTGDFHRQHPINLFMLPLLERINKEKFKVIVF